VIIFREPPGIEKLNKITCNLIKHIMKLLGSITVLALKQLLVVLLVVFVLLNVSVPFPTVVQRRIRNYNNDSESWIENIVVGTFSGLFLITERSCQAVPMAHGVSRQPSYQEASGSRPGQSTWDLWCTKAALGLVFFPPGSSVVPCQYHSIMALHAHISSGDEK
jgi:hypothetical protein